MDATIKWLGGVTLAVLAAFTALALSGNSGADAAIAETDTAAGAARSIPERQTGEEAPIAAIDPAPADWRPEGAIGAKLLADAARKQAEPFIIKRILPIKGPMKYGEWHWNTDGVPDDGTLVVTVDLEARTVSVFRDGYEIGAAVAMLGTEAHPTPTGQFPILWKQRHNVSEKYGNAPMPWSMFLTSDGVAIHGGSEVENGYASHGCIAVPDGFVAKLFAIAKKGDMVVITDGRRIGMGDSIVS